MKVSHFCDPTLLVWRLRTRITIHEHLSPSPFPKTGTKLRFYHAHLQFSVCLSISIALSVFTRAKTLRRISSGLKTWNEALHSIVRYFNDIFQRWNFADKPVWLRTTSCKEIAGYIFSQLKIYECPVIGWQERPLDGQPGFESRPLWRPICETHLFVSIINKHTPQRGSGWMDNCSIWRYRVRNGHLTFWFIYPHVSDGHVLADVNDMGFGFYMLFLEPSVSANAEKWRAKPPSMLHGIELAMFFVTT